jgi:3-deoxy-D-manno-octulosonate 8-phosphate phosphatase (KDO 8-P phosphatase)
VTERFWPPQDEAAYRAAAEQRLGSELRERFARTSLLVYDVDGILTSGRLIYGPQGEALKEFHTHDGLGMVMARVAGLEQAILTGRDSPIAAARAAELRFAAVKIGRFDKRAALLEICTETGIPADRTLYMGDDLIDVPALDAVAIAVSVPDAPSEVRERCHYVTERRGGEGAVREVIELVLQSAGRFGATLRRLGDANGDAGTDAGSACDGAPTEDEREVES